MDVGGPTGILNGEDGAESVVPFGVGDGVAMTLKVLIQWHAPIVAWVVVASVGITLPYFDAYPSKGSPVYVDYPTRQIRTLTFCQAVTSRT